MPNTGIEKAAGRSSYEPDIASNTPDIVLVMKTLKPACLVIRATAYVTIKDASTTMSVAASIIKLGNTLYNHAKKMKLEVYNGMKPVLYRMHNLSPAFMGGFLHPRITSSVVATRRTIVDLTLYPAKRSERLKKPRYRTVSIASIKCLILLALLMLGEASFTAREEPLITSSLNIILEHI